VVDDFGHHPTAIRETLKAAASEIPHEKNLGHLRAALNTTRRNVFQSELASAFAGADAVVVAEVARLEQLMPEERLNPEKLMQDLKASGKNAEYLRTWIPSSPTSQKMHKAATSWWCSATAGFGGFMGNCWSGWGGADRSNGSGRFPAFHFEDYHCTPIR